MSKMGQVNLDLQEQVEELGFESVQEALDNGCKFFINKDNSLVVEDVDKEMMTAHQQYERDRQRIIDNLEMLLNDTPYKVYREVLGEAIEFLKQKEV